jgi:hypothetical protein
MSENEIIESEIKKLRHIYNICVDLLEFDKKSEYRKDKLKKLGIELIEKKNYNRIRSIEREASKAKNNKHIPGNELDLAVLKETGMSVHQPELRKYIVKLYSGEYKDNLVECAKKIKEYEEKLQSKAKRIEKKRPKVKTRTNKQLLKRIIKNHITNSNAYLEPRELNQIKEQFGIELFDAREGYLSDDTISKLFTIRIINDELVRHEEVNLKSLIDTIDSLFELTLTEMDYRKDPSTFTTRGIIKYEETLSSIKEVKNRDYVQEYSKLYEKIKKYYSKLSKEQKEEFTNRLSKSKYSYDKLLTPEEFRQKINRQVKAKINSFDFTNTNDEYKAFTIVEELTHYTKYMTNEELADYYHKLKENNKDYDPAVLQEVFTILIVRRMKVIEDDMTDEEYEELNNKRYKAICSEYFNEKPLFIDADNVIVSNNYAKESIEEKIKVYAKR